MEIGILAQEMPPMDEVFKCLAFRVMGGDMMPRLSHIMGGGEAAQTIPPEIEWLVPRVSCLVGLYKEEETAGRYRTGQNIAKKTTKKQPQSQPRGKMQEKHVGFGVDIPPKISAHKVQMVPAEQSQATPQVVPITTIAPAPTVPPTVTRQASQAQPSGGYIIKP